MRKQEALNELVKEIMGLLILRRRKQRHNNGFQGQKKRFQRVWGAVVLKSFWKDLCKSQYKSFNLTSSCF